MVSLCVSWAENGDEKDWSDRTVPGGGRTGPKHREQSKASATSKPAGEAKRTRNTEQPRRTQKAAFGGPKINFRNAFLNCFWSKSCLWAKKQILGTRS